MQIIGFYTLVVHRAGACKVSCLGWRHQVQDLLSESGVTENGDGEVPGKPESKV